MVAVKQIKGLLWGPPKVTKAKRWGNSRAIFAKAGAGEVGEGGPFFFHQTQCSIAANTPAKNSLAGQKFCSGLKIIWCSSITGRPEIPTGVLMSVLKTVVRQNEGKFRPSLTLLK